MLTQSSDTHPNAERFQISLIRHASMAKRVSRIRSLSQTVIRLSRRAILRANPGLDEKEVNLIFATHHYGADWAGRLSEAEASMKDSDILVAIKSVTEAFEKLNVPYYIGGSVASSAYGIARSTLDADMVADLKMQHISALAKLLQSSYYVDEEMISDAIRRHASFNLIHLETMLKIDIFIAKDDDHDKEAFRRIRKDRLDEDRGAAEVYLVSPEDIILKKLEWYRLGGGVSERQWNDVTGVIKVQENSLDKAYMRYWASELGVEDLLGQAFHESGVEIGSSEKKPVS